MSIVAALQPAFGPAEQLGRARADVELLVAWRSEERLEHAPFAAVARFLCAGDLLVVNTSATLAAALPGRLEGSRVVVHFSTQLGRRRWIVELRGHALQRQDRPPVGALVELRGGGRLTVTARLSRQRPPGRGRARPA